MWIPEETVNRVLEQVDIVDIISQYVQLNKQGKNYFGYCPFHEERTPSFSVEEEKQFFHCFSCKRGGTVFNFIMEIEGITYPEAIIKVAELAGIPIDDQIRGQVSEQKEKTTADYLIDIHEHASAYYHQVLMLTEAGKPALQYLKGRGLSDETIETFQLGFSPGQREALYDYLSNVTDYDDDLLKQSGLFNEKEGKLLDRFANRVIFPIRSNKGKTIAFSGRDFRQQSTADDFKVAKYLNSPETEIFNKRNVLFNLDLARPNIRQQNEVVLFEGYMDVISAYQAGLTHGIASMGTSLTQAQIKQLDRLTDQIVIAYDGDHAGSDASKRAIDLLSKEEGFSLEIVQFPKDSDPDEFIQSKGAEAFLELMTHSRYKPLGFFMRYYRQGINLQNESEQTDYIEKVLQEMVHVPSAIEREYYFKALAEEFNFSLEALKEQFQTYLTDYMQQAAKPTPAKPRIDERQSLQISYTTQTTDSQAHNQAERIILHRLMQFPREVIAILNQYEDFHFTDVDEQSLYVLYVNYYETHAEPSVQEFMALLDNKNLQEKTSELLALTLPEDFNTEEIRDCVASIERKQLSNQLEESKLKMKSASQNGDTKLQNELLLDIVAISQKLEQR